MSDDIESVQEELIEEKTHVRDCLYSKIKVSVKTMDRLIVILLLAIIVSVICGVIF